MSKREVTEFDLRAPEFRHPDLTPDQFEFRDDGAIVRKDRWERAVFEIAGDVGISARAGFEIPDVIAKVEQMVKASTVLHVLHEWLCRNIGTENAVQGMQDRVREDVLNYLEYLAREDGLTLTRPGS